LFLCPFFFHYSSPISIYPLSLHDALPIFSLPNPKSWVRYNRATYGFGVADATRGSSPFEELARPSTPLNPRPPATSGSKYSTVLDRKSTRLNSSHGSISYAVFCLKKKKDT